MRRDPMPPAASRTLGVALLLHFLACAGLAAPVRVTSWSFEPAPAASPRIEEIRLDEAVTALKPLDSEVILLQHVRDWKMCNQLAQALKPGDYRVLVCSAFRDPATGQAGTDQVAILSKQSAYFTWCEAWPAAEKATDPGGFAFAAVTIGNRRIGFFSLASGTGAADPARREAINSAEISAVLGQVEAVKHWNANQPEAFIAGGNYMPVQTGATTTADAPQRLLEEAGFGEAFPELLLDSKASSAAKSSAPCSNRIFALPLGAAVQARTLGESAVTRRATTCELELDPSHILEARAARLAQLHLAETIAKAEAANAAASAPARFEPRLNLGWWLGGIALAVVVAAWLFARGRNRVSRSLSEPRLIGENSESSRGSYTLLIAPTSTTGSGDPPAVSSSQPLIHVGRAALPPSQPDSAIVADPADLSDAADAPAPQRLRPAPAPERIPHGLIPHLAHWFKQRVIRKLVADRGQLMETQEAARLKVLAVDERLSRIESQIQNQTQAYECRIEELTRELHSAKAENREIIQGRINQVKAEMEAARAQRRGAASH